MDIVVGALRSPTGEVALIRAGEEAARMGGTVHLVAHVEPPRDEAGSWTYRDAVAEAEREVRGWAADLLPEGVAWEVHVPSGFTRPSDSIVTVANRIGADLIVIGMRRRSRVGKLVLGSNAADILMRAECPVLSVPAPAETGR